jgi:hypothetical protein
MRHAGTAFAWPPDAGGDAHDTPWVLKVTSADNPPWPGDIVVKDRARAGPPAPSVARRASPRSRAGPSIAARLALG